MLSPAPQPHEVLFTQPILTQPSTQRIFITVPVDSLGRALRELEERQVRLEHVYDY